MSCCSKERRALRLWAVSGRRLSTWSSGSFSSTTLINAALKPKSSEPATLFKT